MEVSRYIHRNPIETVKPLASVLEDYGWSSYPMYLERELSPEWIYKESVLAELGASHPKAAYKRFIDKGVDQETSVFYNKGNWPAVRGSNEFTESAYLYSNAASIEVRKDRREIASEVILRLVSEHFQCAENELIRVNRGAGADNTARSIAIKLCQEAGGMKLKEIGKIFGIGSDSGVTKVISRISTRLSEDETLRLIYKVICQDLTP